jgi:hypothetical protein
MRSQLFERRNAMIPPQADASVCDLAHTKLSGSQLNANFEVPRLK